MKIWWKAIHGIGIVAKKQKTKKIQNGKYGGIHFFLPPPAKMRSLENAVSDTLEELELDEHIEYSIREVRENILYHITFQERDNGNNRCIISVEYSRDASDILDDVAWDGEIDLQLVRCEGIQPMIADMILELLAITLDPDYYDSDDEEEDSDDETITIPSQPSTPPPRSSQPLVPLLQLPQRR